MKSAVEALFIHCGRYNPELALRVNAWRGVGKFKVEFGQWAGTPWDSLFDGFNASEDIELAGQNATGRHVLRLRAVHQPEELASIGRPIALQGTGTVERPVPLSSGSIQVLALEYQDEQGQRNIYYLVINLKGEIFLDPVPPPAPFSGIFLGARSRVQPEEDADRFGRLEVVGAQDVLLEALQVIDGRLKRLALIPVGGVPMIHGDIQLGRLIPLALMGEGMARLASLVLAISDARDGVVFVDEIENGFHHSILRKVWKAIGKVARDFNTQVFATTHSLECIVAAHEAFAEDEHDDFRLHRLDRINGSIRAVTYDQETLAAAIDVGLEVR